MKDLSLSLLSRGCGRFVSSNRKTGRYDGRLDVCFTPQDYYIWKSQDSFLQLSNSGHLRVETESTLPKTYSTRRGPLLLYSKDLVTMETSCHSDTRDRKKCAVQRYTQQVEQQLSTLKELTAAILNYSTQFTSSRLGATSFPPFHLPLAPDLHHPNPPLIHTTQEQSSPELLVQLNPQWVAAERNTEQLKNQPEDKKGDVCNKKRVRLDLFLQIPSTSMTPPPQMEPQPWLHYVAVSPEEEPQAYLDASQQHTKNSGQIEISHQDMEAEHHHPNVICVRGAAEDQGCSIQDGETTSDEGNYETSMSVNRHGRTGLLPPLTVAHSVCHGLSEKTDRTRWEGPSNDEHHEHHLPPIEESRIVIPGRAIQSQTQKDAQPKAETVGYQCQENLNRVSSQLHQLPMVFPGKEEEINGKQRGGEKIERRYSKKVGQGGGGGGARLPSEKGSIIQMEPGEEPPPPVGVLGCVAGRKGPGKQTSLAFLQNQLLDLKDPCESTEANRGVVRGILPLELRDLQNDKSVGSLILGPDGEIIQLSLHDNSQEPPQGDSDTQQQALQVLSAEGEKLPWVIVLQPEHTHTEGGVDLNTDVPVNDQHDQSIHKLLDPHRSTKTNACSPSSHTDPGKPPVAVTKKKTKTTETVTKTWKRPKRDAKNNIRMPPLRECVGKEERSRGNTEAEEEDEEEELGRDGRTSHSSGSDQPGKLQFKDNSSCSEQKINPNEETTKDAVDKKSTNTKRKDAEEAAKTTGKKDLKTSAESDGQTSRMRKEGRSQRQKTGSDTQSTRKQKQEKTDREAEEGQDNAVLHSVKKKVTDREGVKGEVKINEEKKEERAKVASQREESAGGRRRKGRLKHKDLVVGNPEEPLEKEEVDINQEIKELSHLKSTKRWSTTHSDNTKPNSEEDTDHLSTNADKHSSIRSVSSLRSTAATSQFNHRSLRRSAASSCEGSVPTSAMGLTSSCGRLSSCSTVMIREEQLMLNPVQPESSRHRKRQEQQEEAVALHLAQREEQRRQEVERKRSKQEEEERKQQEREQTEERMKSELEEERMKRTEELRLKRLAEEEEQRKRDEELQERARREQAQRERERRRQEEKRRQMERLQRLREEEEQRKKDELECLRLEDERRQEEENKKLQEMDESERIEYLCRKKQEEEDRKNKEEERKRIEEEAALQAAEENRLQTELLTSR
ncbi:uncharacterized protein KIAA2012 homolog isoform X3 [Larimichthys crocea]|uniref:uncharacterized protein KIAA2012 homolog isoform X3 n=1 Tax=Larimichthys crocea TaxID=215358 RepID=UPI000F5F3F22|nr:uncharacterized protein KIAA2012 homolog isoform X3 [Larimichthys crocea]